MPTVDRVCTVRSGCACVQHDLFGRPERLAGVEVADQARRRAAARVVQALAVDRDRRARAGRRAVRAVEQRDARDGHLDRRARGDRAPG